jgi:hypothetical protein
LAAPSGTGRHYCASINRSG